MIDINSKINQIQNRLIKDHGYAYACGYMTSFLQELLEYPHKKSVEAEIERRYNKLVNTLESVV